jgi:hypothetical protein
MSVCTQAKRTLVKSPPELWAELSDPVALARHLGELGEIRIVRTDPERTVEWEAAQISGTVQIEPSGWGTKVTLTANRTLITPQPEANQEAGDALSAPAPTHAPQAAGATLEPQPKPEPAPTPEPEATGATLKPQPKPEPPPAPEPVPLPDPAVVVSKVESEPAREKPQIAKPRRRRGFFARLFRRRTSRREQEPRAGSGVPVEPTQRALEGSSCKEPAHGPPGAAKAAPGVPIVAGPAPADGAADESRIDERPTPDQPAPKVDAAPELVERAASDTRTAPVTQTAPEAQTAVDTRPKADAQTAPKAQPTPLLASDTQTANDKQMAPAAPAPPDISAELAAAEDVATEQVTAVLTSVLDRLGAAHHRPFSRA